MSSLLCIVLPFNADRDMLHRKRSVWPAISWRIEPARNFAEKPGFKLSNKYIVLALNLYKICYNVVRAARKRFIQLFSNILNLNLMVLYTIGQGIKPRIGHNHPPSYPDIASCALFHYGISNLIMISPYLYNTVGHSFTLRHYRNSERDFLPEDVHHLL